MELRVFEDLREDEISEALGILLETVKRDWEFARAWLLKRLVSDWLTAPEKMSRFERTNT